ncbi:hypothetical protein BV20DRAFT_687669 [Pilatotrama ljubarskyi]|nr:hypothetical protein BV20DRAFT_687669 [Pilatotrama ljubarskyi]
MTTHAVGRTSICIASAALVAVVASRLSSRFLSNVRPEMQEGSQVDAKKVRQRLPETLEQWRFSTRTDEEYNAIWQTLGNYLKARGYSIWRHRGLTYLAPPDDLEETCNGFAFAPLHRGWGEDSRVWELSRFECPNPLNRPARAADGRDVVIRVIRIGVQGKEYLEILNYISRGPCSQVTPNHAVPLFELFELDDVTLGVFPRVGCSMVDAYGSWPENSVGDLVDMIMQCLEALGYLHSIGVAHRDAFKDNFLVQWFPESMASHQLTISRPRVFLNDFETAVFFTEDVPASDRVCVGLPLPPSFPSPERYFRPIPSELTSREPYNPFKLDVWQFGDSLRDLKTTIPDIDAVLADMTVEKPNDRLTAFEALKRISATAHAMSHESLKIPPVVVRSQYTPGTPLP